MTTKTVYQIDTSGLFLGETVADESPREPGVWLMPAGTIDTAPPADVPEGKRARWNGSAWTLANNMPPAANDNTALEKLQAFLVANPDVQKLLNQGSV